MGRNEIGKNQVFNKALNLKWLSLFFIRRHIHNILYIISAEIETTKLTPHLLHQFSIDQAYFMVMVSLTDGRT